jgi:hypothetical protein
MAAIPFDRIIIAGMARSCFAGMARSRFAGMARSYWRQRRRFGGGAEPSVVR